MTLEEFANYVKAAFNVKGLRVVGDLSETVKKVAIIGGDGGKYYPNAIRKGADVFITGDLYYHTAIDAKMEGLHLIDPGHNIEKVMKEGVARKLSELCQKQKLAVEFIPSEKNTEPYQFL